MTAPLIHIDLDAIDARLAGGDRWITGWGDYKSSTGPTCLHGAIRYCQPVPGDAYLIEQVGTRYGFGVGDNDSEGSWESVRAKVPADITDAMLAETFGPQWEPIVALVRRAAVLTEAEATNLTAARPAARAAARDAAWDAAQEAAWAAAWDAAQEAAWAAAQEAAWAAAWEAAWAAAQEAAWAAAWEAARALAVRDLIGSHGFTQDHYDTLTGPWRKVISPIHPDDKDLS